MRRNRIGQQRVCEHLGKSLCRNRINQKRSQPEPIGLIARIESKTECWNRQKRDAAAGVLFAVPLELQRGCLAKAFAEIEIYARVPNMPVDVQDELAPAAGHRNSRSEENLRIVVAREQIRPFLHEARDARRSLVEADRGGAEFLDHCQRT